MRKDVISLSFLLPKYSLIFSALETNTAFPRKIIGFCVLYVFVDKLSKKHTTSILSSRFNVIIRKIDLIDELVDVLESHKKKRSKLTKYVFHNKMGNPLCPDNMVKRDFKNILTKSGVKRVRWHDLRHTYASLLISKNLPICVFGK